MLDHRQWIDSQTGLPISKILAPNGDKPFKFMHSVLVIHPSAIGSCELRRRCVSKRTRKRKRDMLICCCAHLLASQLLTDYLRKLDSLYFILIIQILRASRFLFLRSLAVHHRGRSARFPFKGHDAADSILIL